MVLLLFQSNYMVFVKTWYFFTKEVRQFYMLTESYNKKLETTRSL